LVVTEGTETEPIYVERLKNYLRSQGSDVHVKPVGVGKDPAKVVDEAISRRDEVAGSDRAYDEVVALVDVDLHASLPAALVTGRRAGIIVLVSNLKFEVWLRWHAEPARSALGTKQLDAICEKLGVVKDKKLPLAFPIEKVDRAIKIAYLADKDLAPNRKGPDPSTAMPVLVDLIRGSTS